MTWIDALVPQVPSIISAIAAVTAAIAASRSALLAGRQIENQQGQFESSMQPYVWADIRPRDEDGQVLVLVVGNSGPTVATRVRIHVDADVPHAPRHRATIQTALDRFNSGHASLPPGRTHAWGLGTGTEILHDPDADLRLTVTITGDGPHGPMEPLVYPIDLNDWRETAMHAQGSLYRIEKAINDQGKAMAKALTKHAGR